MRQSLRNNHTLDQVGDLVSAVVASAQKNAQMWFLTPSATDFRNVHFSQNSTGNSAVRDPDYISVRSIEFGSTPKAQVAPTTTDTSTPSIHLPAATSPAASIASSATHNVSASTKLITSPSTKTASVSVVSEKPSIVRSGAIGTAPDFNSPPGGGSAFGVNTALTQANGTSYLHSGWLGADPLAGQYGGGGGFDGIDSNDTFSSGEATVRQDPLNDSNLQSAAGQAGLNTLAGDQNAFQNIINVDNFLLNNINIPHPSGNVAANNVYVELEGQFSNAAIETDVPSLGEGAECAAAIGAAGIILATGEGTTSSLAASAFALLGGTQACESVINYLAGNVSADFGWAGFLTSDLAGAQQGMADVNTNQNHPDVAKPLASPQSFGTTPNFVPSAAFLESVKGHLTPSAMAKYFPNG